MFDFASAFHVQRMKSGNPIVYILREQFGSFAGSPHKADACDRIAGSLREIGQASEAAMWYEVAGALVCERVELNHQLRAIYALEEYEKALECHTEARDPESMAECSEIIAGLKRACAPA